MKKKRSSRGERAGIEQLVQWVGFVGVIVVFGLLYVWQQIQTRDLMSDIIQLESRRAALKHQNAQLALEVTRLSDNDRVETVAVELFEMEQPVIGQVISITDPALALQVRKKDGNETELASLAITDSRMTLSAIK